MAVATSLSPDLEAVRERARHALQDVQPVEPPLSLAESNALLLSSRTSGGRNLPAYYLVYFLLADLLGYPDLGRSEKTAWTIPIRFRGRLYSIEHRKFGAGVFAPNWDPAAMMSAPPSDEAESDAREIAAAVGRAVTVAEPYFAWRAEQAVSTARLNVYNVSDGLFDRYVFFREQFRSLAEEVVRDQDATRVATSALPDGTGVPSGASPAYARHARRREATWNAQAAIEAFFGWTEHAFIHLAALQGRVRTGGEVAALAAADWKAKFKAALDLADPETKRHYDTLLDLRAQLRNYMAHGAFGKRGEAFSFHSGAGAVPVLLTQGQRQKYALTGRPAFDERSAIAEIETFVAHLWSGARAPAKVYILSELPTILTHAADGTYARAMRSEQDMEDLVEHLTRQFDAAADMDW